MSDVENKLHGHRNTIRDHIKKYRRYEAGQDSDFALKTIRRIQNEIGDLKRKNPRTSSASEDTWRPGYGISPPRH